MSHLSKTFYLVRVVNLLTVGFNMLVMSPIPPEDIILYIERFAGEQHTTCLCGMLSKGCSTTRVAQQHSHIQTISTKYALSFRPCVLSNLLSHARLLSDIRAESAQNMDEGWVVFWECGCG
jgi:hypothetical protein